MNGTSIYQIFNMLHFHFSNKIIGNFGLNERVDENLLIRASMHKSDVSVKDKREHL